MSGSYHSSSTMFSFPASPGSSWKRYKSKFQRYGSRFKGTFRAADPAVLVAFFLFGVINNVLYVIILSAALDLVGPNIPKGVVLLADVMPSFITKLIAPYFIHAVPYHIRILVFVALSSGGMLLIALTPSAGTGGSVMIKLLGVIIGSLSSGGGELSFLGLTHYYGQFSLAAWGSGTGGAGLIGAGLYVMLTTWIGFSVPHTLLASAFLPLIMLLSFFVILPHGPLQLANKIKTYNSVPTTDLEDDVIAVSTATESLLEPPISSNVQPGLNSDTKVTFSTNFRRARALFFPYMLPLLLVYIAEYTINQGVAPTLLFPLPATPFSHYRAFYSFYNFLYQIGVFIARSSTPFIRVHNLYIPSLLQVANLLILTSQSLYDWIPSVYIVFVIVFWEGLLGGAVYVNTFAEIMEKVPDGEREFSLGATSVSDSGGICVAGFLGMALEVFLCGWQVERGRDWCRKL